MPIVRLNLCAVITILLIFIGTLFGWTGYKNQDANTVLATEAENGEQQPELDESFFYGMWAVTTCAGTFYTTLRANGTTSTRLVKKNSGKSVYVSSGSWKIRDNAIVWIHSRNTSRTKAGMEDINPIINIEKNRVTLRETNGALRILTRVDE